MTILPPRQMRALLPAVTFSLAAVLVAHAVHAQRSPLSVERLTNGPPLVGVTPIGPAWSTDSRTLAFLWSDRAGTARTLWTVDRRGSSPRRVVGDSASAPISAFAWTATGDALIYAQRGNLYRLALVSGVVSPITSDGAERSAWTLSPNGQWISFLRDGDLWVRTMAGGAERRLTTLAIAARSAIALGTYSGRDAEVGDATWGGAAPTHSWSPDSRTIALHYVDRRAVPLFSMPYYLSDTAEMNRVRRGAPGEINETRRMGLLTLATGDLKWIELSNEASTRVVDYSWSPTGTLLVDRESDDAIERTLHLVSGGGAVQQLWNDRRDTRIYNDIASVWSSDGRSVIMTSDLDDRYRLYRVTLGSSTPVPLTANTADVAGVGIPRAASRTIDFLSTAPRPSERHLFRLDERSGRTRQLTTMAGVHSPTVSPDGGTIALISSSDTLPPELYLLDTRPGATERRITYSQPQDFSRVPWVAARYFTVPGTTRPEPLHVRVLLPPAFDSTKRYPVLFGPAYSNTVRKRWAGTYGMLQQFLAIEKEYIVVQVDVRGSTGYGRDFREAFLMDWGGGDLDDLEAVATYLRGQRYVDPTRFGIWGSSYGGTLTIYALLKKPGLFQAGVAGAAATDPRLFGSDDVAIVRRPLSHPATFERGALQYAGNLSDHLLLIHGMQDDVVPFSSAVKLAEEFMRLGKTFDFAFAPAATHGWTQRPYYARYLLNRLVDHFDRFLGPGPRAP